MFVSSCQVVERTAGTIRRHRKKLKMEENHRPAGNIVNGPLRASADLTAIAVMKNAKKMKLEKVMSYSWVASCLSLL